MARTLSTMARRTSLSLMLAVVACGGRTVDPAPAPAGQVGAKGARAASAAPTDPELDRELPLDARIRRGVLDNGLTYYVIEHHRPEKRAQLWLAVNTGSIMEDEDQRGLAHFVEHMAFNGTAKYEKSAIIDYLEGIGMQFGPDVNAYTSFDETVYTLQVPTDSPAIVDKGLDILHQWAGSVSFDKVEVDKERGVVLEEWRLGRGAFMRLLDKQYPILFKGSRYAERLPIGQADTIKGAPRDTLVRFYKDWYRPDLMAVVAVGDFSGADLEKQIKEKFGGLPRAARPRPRAAVEVPPHAETLVSIETDPEMPMTSVEIHNKMPHRSERTARDYRRIVVDQLYHTMLNQRLDEIRQRPDAPFMWAYSNTGSNVRTCDSFTRGAGVKEGETERALRVLFEEVLRVERHGFTQSELDRAKKQTLRGFQQSVKELDKKDSREFAEEAVRNYLEGETMPGRVAELALVERFLPAIKLDELNGLARDWGGEANRVILVRGPAKAKMPSRDQLLAVVKSVEKTEVAAYKDEAADRPLMARPPTAGKVTAEKTIAELGVTEWTLSNGVRVIVKPTDFQNDEVLMEAFSPGGESLVTDADFDSARFVSDIVSESGVGEFDPIRLRKLLAGKLVDVNVWLGGLEEGMNGRASPDDLETLFELVHLGFTAPRVDPKAFETWRSREGEEARNRRLSPERAFFEDMTSFLSQDHPRTRPVTPETVARVDLERVHAIYKERFKDAGDFTFVLVGNLDLERTKGLAETYLASLPSTGRAEKWRDVGIKMPKGVKKKTLHGGTEPKSFVYLTYHGKEKWSRDGRNDMDMLSRVLDIRLREVLREDMGGVYGAWASGGISRRPREERSFTVFFGCAPDNVDKLVKAVFTEVAAIQKKGIGDAIIGKVKATRAREREVNLKENWFWASELVTAYRFGDDPRRLLEFEPLQAKVTSARVRAAARKYLTSSQYVLGVLVPEAAAAAGK